MSIDVEICEVGLRDGLQNTKRFMPTEAKMAWISAEAAAGVREIEVCSFVPATLIPQFTDAGAVVRHALGIPGLSVAALVPNYKGAERAIAAGVHKLSLPVSVSRAHSAANVRKTPEQQVEECRRIAELCRAQDRARRPHLTAGLSTAFGCTMQGAVDEDDVRRIAVALVEAGADEVSLADTVGYANPAQIARLFKAVKADVGDRMKSIHLHNTRGLGLANALAAYEAGARAFDASLGGLGGCPFAPGASGNVVTEDLVFMFEAMGVATGIRVDGLLAARRIVEQALPGEPLYGHMALAGTPKGFVPTEAVA